MEKIQAGHYVDFKELLSDNVALLKRLHDVGYQQPSSGSLEDARGSRSADLGLLLLSLSGRKSGGQGVHSGPRGLRHAGDPPRQKAPWIQTL